MVPGPKWHPIPYVVHYFWPEPWESSALQRKYAAIWDATPTVYQEAEVHRRYGNLIV